ncbi:MAG TPA: DNA-3-methyladenine glycosylase I [Kiloniellales bacterium]|jgi:3-methyladenine DNA glycosylase Tag
MVDFQPIYEAAMKRAGGEAALRQVLPDVKSPDALRALGDDRYLSQMSLRVFRAGLKHSMVDGKWPAFEEVFHGFDPPRIRAMNDEQLEALLGDARIIRHWGKIRSVRDNASALCDLAKTNGGMGAYLAGWPAADTVGLWEDLSKRFSQLGGNSGPYFLRMVGKDTFLLTQFVLKAMAHWGAYDGSGKGKRERAKIQDVFNAWVEATSRPLSHLSLLLARSVD